MLSTRIDPCPTVSTSEEPKKLYRLIEPAFEELPPITPRSASRSSTMQQPRRRMASSAPQANDHEPARAGAERRVNGELSRRRSPAVEIEKLMPTAAQRLRPAAASISATGVSGPRMCGDASGDSPDEGGLCRPAPGSRPDSVAG